MRRTGLSYVCLGLPLIRLFGSLHQLSISCMSSDRPLYAACHDTIGTQLCGAGAAHAACLMWSAVRASSRSHRQALDSCSRTRQHRPGEMEQGRFGGA